MGRETVRYQREKEGYFGQREPAWKNFKLKTSIFDIRWSLSVLFIH